MKTTVYLILSAMIDLIIWIILVKIGIYAVQHEWWMLLVGTAILTGIYGAVTDSLDEAAR